MPLGSADLESVNRSLLAFSRNENMYKAEEDIAMDYADPQSSHGLHDDMDAFVGHPKYKRSIFSALSFRGLKRSIIASATTCLIILSAHASR